MKNKLLLILGILAALLILVLVVPLTVFWFNGTFRSSQVPASAAIKNEPASSPLSPATVFPTHTPEVEVCGNTGKLALLLTGVGIANQENNADAIRYVKIDFDNRQVTVLAVPRDLLVTLPGMPNQPQERLGSAFNTRFLATEGSLKDKNQSGTELVAQVLQDNFSLYADYYITLRLDTLEQLVDLIGGVEVDVPTPFTMSDGSLIQAGSQVLDGRTSMEYIRSISDGEAARLQRQNFYFQALRKKILSLGIIADLPEILDQFQQAIFTDLSLTQIGSLVCSLEQIPVEQVKFYEIGGEMVSTQVDGAMTPDLEKINAFLEEIQLWR